MTGSLSSMSFRRLVSSLKQTKKTVSVVEQCCGGLLQSSIMSQPGSSQVFWGGTVAYNTKHSKALMLNDQELHSKLVSIPKPDSAEEYIQSKLEWTRLSAIAYCQQIGTDYAIVEGGAAGPTFRPDDLNTGFAVLAVAGKDPQNGQVSLLDQTVVRSNHANREGNMRLFADAAADLATGVIQLQHGIQDNRAAAAPKDNGSSLDRATHLRSNEAALKQLEPHAKYVVLRGNQILADVNDTTKPHFLAMDEVKKYFGDRKTQLTFLGKLTDGTPYFGIDIIADDGDDNSSDSEFIDTRTSAPLFSPIDNELALYATAFAQWQRRSSHCNLCGSPQTLVDGGTCRKCTGCGAMSWPRQDPSIISVISSRDGQRLLLARSKRHPPRLHTTLAGFVEAGETMENAVARETWEEVGIRIDTDSVEYIGSQPWPFPQSCMLGFTATADDTVPLNIDENEIVEAGWFDKDLVSLASSVEGPTMQHEVAEAVDPKIPLLIPPKGVIARKLIDTWLEGK